MAMIKVENLSKHFGQQQVLAGIQLELAAGQKVALVGPNGSGKTTLLKCILGLVHPSQGRIQVRGADTQLGSDYRNALGYMPQIGRFPEHMSVRQLFNLMIAMRPDVPPAEHDRELYDQFEIGAMAHKRLGLLSGGMRQKVSAALAFFFAPSIIILDEPSAALDPVANEQLKQKLRKTSGEGRLLVFTSHLIYELDDITDQLIYMIEGRILLNSSLNELREETGLQTVHQIILQLVKQQQQPNHVENQPLHPA